MDPEQTPTPDGETAAADGAASGRQDGAVCDAAGLAASPVTVVLDALSAQVRALQTAPMLTLSDEELRAAVIAVHRLANQVEAATVHLVRALDDRPEAMPTCPPGKVAATFLVHALRLDPGTAARDVAAARSLDPDGAGVGVDRGRADTLSPDAVGLGLPEVGAALAAGDISRRHVDHAIACLTRIDQDVLAHVDPDGIAGIQRVDEFLAEQARRHAPHVFRRVCTQLEEALNPDAGFDPNAHEKRYLHLGTDAAGMLVGRFALSPADGLIVRNVIHALSKPSAPPAGSEADGAERDGAAAGPAQGGLPLRDPRTAEQRRADALTHLARLALHGTTDTGDDIDSASDSASTDTDTDTDTGDLTPDSAGDRTGGGDHEPSDTTGSDTTDSDSTGSGTMALAGAAATPPACTATAGPGLRTPPPCQGVHISLIATLDQLTAALTPHPTTGAGLGSDLGSGGGPLPRHVLAQLLCTALISPTILDGGGAVLAHGRARRLATPAQRRAVFARDRGCVIPGCTSPPHWCDVHHVTPWAAGGLTDVEALVLVCGHHHTAVHAGTWTIQMIDGVPWVIPPPWIDPLQRPIRNTIHHDERTAHRLAAHLGDQLALDLDTGLDLDPATGASPTSPTSAGLRGAEPCSPGRPPPPSTCPETSPETSEPPSPPDDP
ncbi:MAG: DUF222 domain-containing protein [Kineosporiaceae bacterium]|nr:DUF222 domain-containing protein [Kineosporiaceae bacterium]